MRAPTATSLLAINGQQPWPPADSNLLITSNAPIAIAPHFHAICLAARRFRPLSSSGDVCFGHVEFWASASQLQIATTAHPRLATRVSNAIRWLIRLLTTVEGLAEVARAAGVAGRAALAAQLLALLVVETRERGPALLIGAAHGRRLQLAQRNL